MATEPTDSDDADCNDDDGVTKTNTAIGFQLIGPVDAAMEASVFYAWIRLAWLDRY